MFVRVERRELKWSQAEMQATKRWNALRGETPLPTPDSCRLEVDGYTKVEVTALGQIAGINTLIEHAVAR